MTHRLYFVLPDVASARQLADDLLLARVEDRRHPEAISGGLEAVVPAFP